MKTEIGNMFTVIVGGCSVELCLASLAAAKVTGATVTKAYGVWKGTEELSCIVQIAGPTEDEIDDIAEVLRQGAKQESVLVTRPDASSYLLARD